MKKQKFFVLIASSVILLLMVSFIPTNSNVPQDYPAGTELTVGEAVAWMNPIYLEKCERIKGSEVNFTDWKATANHGNSGDPIKHPNVPQIFLMLLEENPVPAESETWFWNMCTIYSQNCRDGWFRVPAN